MKMESWFNFFFFFPFQIHLAFVAILAIGCKVGATWKTPFGMREAGCWGKGGCSTCFEMSFSAGDLYLLLKFPRVWLLKRAPIQKDQIEDNFIRIWKYVPFITLCIKCFYRFHPLMLGYFKCFGTWFSCLCHKIKYHIEQLEVVESSTHFLTVRLQDIHGNSWRFLIVSKFCSKIKQNLSAKKKLVQFIRIVVGFKINCTQLIKKQRRIRLINLELLILNICFVTMKYRNERI